MPQRNSFSASAMRFFVINKGEEEILLPQDAEIATVEIFKNEDKMNPDAKQKLIEHVVRNTIYNGLPKTRVTCTCDIFANHDISKNNNTRPFDNYTCPHQCRVTGQDFKK